MDSDGPNKFQVSAATFMAFRSKPDGWGGWSAFQPVLPGTEASFSVRIPLCSPEEMFALG